MFLFKTERRDYILKKKSVALIITSILILSACGSTLQEVANEDEYFDEEVSGTEKLSEENTKYSDISTGETIENYSSEEYVSEYTMEEIKELFFGEWEVSKLLGFSEVQNDYTNYPDGHDVIGNHIVINEKVFSSVGLEKYERYQSEVLNPIYEVSDIKQYYLIYNMNETIKEDSELYDMIVNDELQDLEIKGIRDGKGNCSSAVQIMISSNRKLIILTMDGVYYLLEKV